MEGVSNMFVDGHYELDSLPQIHNCIPSEQIQLCMWYLRNLESYTFKK